MASTQQAPSAKTLEQIRTSARRRLIGAIILVLLAVLILPWILESTPRDSQTEVEINTGAVVTPNNTVNTVAVTQPNATTVESVGFSPFPSTNEPVGLSPDELHTVVVPAPSTTVRADNPLFVVEGQEENYAIEPAVVGTVTTGSIIAEGNPVQHTNDGYSIRPTNKPIIASKRKPGETITTAVVTSDAARAAALLGEPVSTVRTPTATTTAELSQKFIIQVGAYSDAVKVNEVRAKLTMAGYTTYTEEASTNTGKMTRVRIGPINGRATADEMAKKIANLGLPVSVLPA